VPPVFFVVEFSIRIIMDCGNRDFCRNLFLKTQTFVSYVTIYTFPLLFVVNNSDEFLINSEIQDINTRHSSNLHMPLANFYICQRGDYYSGIKIANSLPYKIKNVLTICGHLKVL